VNFRNVEFLIEINGIMNAWGSSAPKNISQHALRAAAAA
jgi:hypothetical protein